MLNGIGRRRLELASALLLVLGGGAAAILLALIFVERLAPRFNAPDTPSALLLAARREFGWGAKKLVQVLARRHPA